MHLATANVAAMLTGYEDPSMADFIAQLESVNASADSAPGFVWRFIEDDEGAEVARGVGNGRSLCNMSVWKAVVSRGAWVYSGQHLDVVRRRTQWFEKPTRSPFVLWWVERGCIPTVAEAKLRFQQIWANGPSADAFTFSKRFPPA